MTIKPWRERVGFRVDYRLLYPTAVERAMEQEIQELREELAKYRTSQTKEEPNTDRCK